MIKRYLFIFLQLIGNILVAQETITINAGIDSGQFKNYTGFLHGEINLESNPVALDLIQKLKPNFWRNSDWHQTQKLACSLGINTTMVISDFYANFKGGYANAKPWLNWVEYETFVRSLVKQYIAAGLAPNYWDLWNEPNDVSYWSGSLAQLVECFKRTSQVIHAINPAIKVVGPSINSYDKQGITFILDSLASNGVTLNAVSWHEFGLPDSLSVHTNDFRNRCALHPLWKYPEIHINEYSPKQTNQIPAFRLAWFYHLELSNVNWANTACWSSFDGLTNWSDCSVGLNGLFWYDEQSPLPAYWTTRAYAEMIKGKRLFCNHSDAKTLALSSKIDSLQEIRLLIGRYYAIDNGTCLPSDIGKESSNVILTINNYPYLKNGTIALVVQKIPKGDLKYQNSPLNAPINVFNGITTISGGVINLTFENFLDGDVYYVYFNSTTILNLNEKAAQPFSIYPNPGTSSIDIVTTEKINEKLFLINNIGQTLKEEKLQGDHFTINIADLPSGIYFVRIGLITKKIIKL